MAANLVQVGVECPGVKPALAVGHKTKRAVARTERGVEFEQRLDEWVPARMTQRGGVRAADVEIRGLVRASVSRSIVSIAGRPAIVPMVQVKASTSRHRPSAQEQPATAPASPRLQRRLEGGEPVFGRGLRHQASAILDNGHPKPGIGRKWSAAIRLSYCAIDRLDRAAAGDISRRTGHHALFEERAINYASPIAIGHLPRENFGTWEFPVLHVRGGTSTGLIIWDRIAPKHSNCARSCCAT